jgi:DNA-binding Lrp family transcriptional regulator
MIVNKDDQIDNIDLGILRLLCENPNITHSEIAEKVDRSQPTVGVRIQKLKDKGVCSFMGIKKDNIQDLEKELVLIYLSAQKEDLLPFIRDCKEVIYAFSLTGFYNILLLLSVDRKEKLVKKKGTVQKDKPEEDLYALLSPVMGCVKAIAVEYIYDSLLKTPLPIRI